MVKEYPLLFFYTHARLLPGKAPIFMQNPENGRKRGLRPSLYKKEAIFFIKNKVFLLNKLFSMSKDARYSATLILMKISHFDRTALYGTQKNLSLLFFWQKSSLFTT